MDLILSLFDVIFQQRGVFTFVVSKVCIQGNFLILPSVLVQVTRTFKDGTTFVLQVVPFLVHYHRHLLCVWYQDTPFDVGQSGGLAEIKWLIKIASIFPLHVLFRKWKSRIQGFGTMKKVVVNIGQ